MFEPLRFVTSSQVGFTNPTINKVTMIMTQVNEDLETNGETSDFWSLSEEVKTAEVGQFFLAYQIYINFDFHQHPSPLPPSKKIHLGLVSITLERCQNCCLSMTRRRFTAQSS